MRKKRFYTSITKASKILKKILLLFVFTLLFKHTLHSQVLVQYDAANYNAAPLNSLSASGCSSGLASYSTLQISAASTTPYGYCAGRFAFCGYFQITAKSQPGYAYCSSAAPSLYTTPDYLTFTVTPNSSNCVYITQFNITMGTYSTGGDKVLVGYSNNGGATWVSGPTFTLPHTTAGGGSSGTGNCGPATPPGSNCATMALYTWNITPFSSATPVIFKIIPYDASTCDCTNGANGNHEWACTQVEVDGTVAPLPNITVTNPSACAGSSVSLTASGASTYTWNTGSTANPLTVTPGATSYTVTGTSAAGCTNTAVANLTVNPSPTITVNSPSVCSGSSVTLTAGGATTYTWSTGSNVSSITVTPGATSYTVTGASAAGCTNTAVANVTINTPPAVTVNTPSICSGTSVNLTAAGASTYTWNTGSNTSSINVTPGATSYTVTGTSAAGCTNTAIANITVNTPPTITVNNPTICSGASVNLTAAGANTYTWNTGSNANPLSVTPGAASYTVTGTSAAGCTSTAVANVTVNTPPTVTVNNPSICSGSSVNLIAAGASTYTWNTGSSSNPLGVTPGATTYTVTGTSVAGCTNTAVANITVNPLPTITVNSPTTCLGSSVNLTASGANTYTWNTGSSANPLTVTPGATAYTVTGTSAAGCTNTAVASITINTLAVSVTSTSVSCGASNGTAASSVTGGIGPFTYSWSPTGGTAANATGLTAGTYSVKVTDSQGCSSTGTVTVSGPTTSFTASATGTPVSCNGGANGTATVTIIGGAPPYTYTWSSGGGNAATASGLSAGVYIISITDANGCTGNTNVTITQPTLLTVTPTQSNVTCNGGTNGSATVTATGGTATYSYSWSPTGGTTATVSSLAAGTYSATITDSKGCTKTSVVTITQPTTITIVPSQTNVLCNGGNNGTASVSASGGTSPYTYSWSPSGGTASSASGLAAGNYSAIVTDANGCKQTQPIIITQPAIIAPSITTTSASCGAANGTASAAITGGTSPYTYTWSPGGGNAATASGLAGGVYTVTIKDINSCTATATATVPEATSFTASIASASVACNGAATGTASVTITGGIGPFTYTWSPTGGNAAQAVSLAAGNYQAAITDHNGCTNTVTTTIAQPTAFTVTAGQGSILCNAGTTTASVSIIGATPAYSYTWLPSGGNGATSSAIVAGNYTVGITDANNCSTTHLFNITQPTALNITVSSTSVSCGGSNGTAAAVVTGGTSPYTYTWSPIGGNTANASGLTGGIYTVNISDAHSCLSSSTVQVSQPVSFTATATTTSVTCNGAANGTASVTITGGTGPFTYSWSPFGGTGAQATGLTAGNYQATVTDPNGCSAIIPVSILQPTALTLATSTGTILCNAGTTAASVTVNGGTPAYTYTWSPSGGNNNMASGLTAGNYTVLVNDINGCANSVVINLTQPTSLILTPATASITCNGASTGVAIISASGGTPGYTYTWSPSGGNSSSATGLSAGNYTVSVSDHNSCPAATTLVIVQASPITTSVTSTAAFCNQPNGTASIAAAGGTPGYTYTWSPSGGNNMNASGLIGGTTYTIAIEDANNCLTNMQVTIGSNSSVNLSVSSTPATCGINNGTVTVIASGGAPAQSGYTYTWTPGVSLGSSALNLAPGVYSISAEDSLGCINTQTITVGNKPSPVLSVASNSISCFGASTGSATVTINTGTGTAPYAYSWVPGGWAGSTATNLASGNYTITVIDSANCMATSLISINQPPALTVVPSSTLATCGNANGVASCIVTGGTPGYTYTWAPAGGNSSTATSLAGNIIYTVSVNDANNCQQMAFVLVNQTPAISLSVSAAVNATCFGTSTGAATVAATGGTPATYTYSWMPGGGVNNIETGLAVGVYTISVQDINSCTATTTLNIQQPPALSVSANNQTICYGASAILTASVSGGNGSPVTYTWNPSNINTSSVNINPLNTTTYSVSAQNTGCPQIAQASGVVTVYPMIVLSITPADSICKGKQATLNASATGGSGVPFTYNWNTGQVGSPITVSPAIPTVYTVTASNAVCPAITATTQVSIYANPTLTLSSTPTSGCGFVCVSFQAGATNVAGNNIVPPYKWQFGDGSTANGVSVGHCYNNTGNYNVTLTAVTQNNCIDTLQKNHFIQVNPNPVANFSASTYTTDINDATINFYNLSSHNVTSWNWYTDGSIYTTVNPSHTYLTEGTYPVTLIVKNAEGCSDTITQDITIIPYFTFYAPNCLTPNGDGLNEKFLPIGMGWDNNTYNLWVYDRWGLLIFSTTDPNKGWDGTLNNQLVQEDTYVWKVKLNDVFENVHEYHGQVSVIR